MKKIMLLFFAAAFALLAFRSSKNFIVTGKITDDKGNPVPSASVRISGTQIGVHSELNGTFSINVKDGDVLEISYVGYETQRIAMHNGKTVVDVQLKPAQQT